MANVRLDGTLTVQEIVKCRWDDESKNPVCDPVDVPAQGESEFEETIGTGLGALPPGGSFAYDELIVLTDCGDGAVTLHTRAMTPVPMVEEDSEPYEGWSFPADDEPTLARYEWNRTVTWDPPEWGLGEGIVRRRSVIVYTLLDQMPEDTCFYRDAPCERDGFLVQFIPARVPAGSQVEIRRTMTLKLKRVLVPSPRSLTELLQAVSELQG